MREIKSKSVWVNEKMWALVCDDAKWAGKKANYLICMAFPTRKEIEDWLNEGENKWFNGCVCRHTIKKCEVSVKIK